MSTFTFNDVPLVLDHGEEITLGVHAGSLDPVKLYEIFDTLSDFAWQTDSKETFRKLLAETYRPDGLRSLWQPPQSPIPRQLGIELPRWPASPRFRLNRLYWPTGATRHSHIHTLVTANTLTNILAGDTASPTTAGDLVIDTGDGQVSCSMYMLPPKPITSADNKLYLLTLVDERYFWPHKLAFSISAWDETWDSYIDKLATALGVTINRSTIESDWGGPHWRLDAREQSAALLLDAAASTLCRTLVADLDGTYTLMDWRDSQARETSNASLKAGQQRMGGVAVDPDESDDSILEQFRSAALPEQVTVAFRQMYDGNNIDGALQVVETTASDFYGDAETTGATKSFYTTAQINYTTNIDGTDWEAIASSETDANNLAQLISEAYFNFIGASDQIWSGIVVAQPSGLSDHIEWEFSGRDIGTRLVARPFLDIGPNELYHRLPSDFDPQGIALIGKAQETITASTDPDTASTGLVEIFRFEDEDFDAGDVTSTMSALSTSYRFLRAWNTTGGDVTSGMMLQMKLHASGRWMVDVEAC